jgi:hypothetical protein
LGPIIILTSWVYTESTPENRTEGLTSSTGSSSGSGDKVASLSSAYTGSGSSAGSDAADEISVLKAPKKRAKTGAKYTSGISVNADNKMKAVTAIKRAIEAHDCAMQPDDPALHDVSPNKKLDVISSKLFQIPGWLFEIKQVKYGKFIFIFKSKLLRYLFDFQQF